MTISQTISDFVTLAIKAGGWMEMDRIYLQNRVLAMIGEAVFEPSEIRSVDRSSIDLMDELVACALSNQQIGDSHAEREIFEDVGHGRLHGGGFFGVVGGFVPQLQVTTHAQQHHFLEQPGGGTQLRRDQHTACGVHRHIHGIAQKNAFPPLRLHGQLGNTCPKRLPGRTWEQHQTTVRVFGQGDLAVVLCQGVTVPGGHGKPSLRIDKQR